MTSSFHRAKMMLDAERLVEAKFVAQLQLAPELLVALVRRHAGLGPDVGKVGKFHEITSSMVHRPLSYQTAVRPSYPCRECLPQQQRGSCAASPTHCVTSLIRNFPPRLADGYQAFVDTRLPLEASRFSKARRGRPEPEVMVICCCDSRVSPEVILTPIPASCSSFQRRQSGPALFADRVHSRRLGRAGVRGAGTQRETHHGDGPFALRWHPRLCRTQRAP